MGASGKLVVDIPENVHGSATKMRIHPDRLRPAPPGLARNASAPCLPRGGSIASGSDVSRARSQLTSAGRSTLQRPPAPPPTKASGSSHRSFRRSPLTHMPDCLVVDATGPSDAAHLSALPETLMISNA